MYQNYVKIEKAITRNVAPVVARANNVQVITISRFKSKNKQARKQATLILVLIRNVTNSSQATE